MSNVVGQVKIDFEVIPTYEIYTLWVGDSSDWKYLEDKESTIGIKVPNSTKELLFPFKKKSLNIFNSNDLGVSCFKSCAEQEYVPIPDGLYTIKVYSSSQYQNKERWFFKTDNLQLEVDKAFIKLGFEYKKEDEDYIKKLSDREFEVFQFISKGTKSISIAKEMNISIKTVEAHKLRIRTKLNLKTSGELNKYALEWKQRN